MSEADAPTRYTVRFPAPAEHVASVEAHFPPPAGGGDLELMMAVWTPGSYLLREFARHVHALEARGPDGEPLAVDKVRKNRWRIAAAGRSVIVRYRLVCRELTVRTNFVDADFALLNGAGTFLVAADPRGPLPGGFEIHVEPAPGWNRLVTPLPPAPEPSGDGALQRVEEEGGGGRFVAIDYETLVDSPLYAGNGSIVRFEVAGVPHVLVEEGGGDRWDGRRAADALERLVEAHRRLWGELPYERFVFMNLLVEAHGGLEHRDGTVIMASRWQAATRAGWIDWLRLASHELFHAWNGKRLRPVELGPFDYEREVYTRSLWAVEGLTSYYDLLLVHRAGLVRRGDLLDGLSKHIERLETSPGRRVQSLHEASFDAWIKYYRPDAESLNTITSYYIKGAVVAFLLDVAIRRATGDARSLDDVLRLAWHRFSGVRGYAPRELFETVATVGGASVADRLTRMVTTTDDLDYREALDWLGLRFGAGRKARDRDADPEEDAAGWLGAETEVEEGRLIVRRIPSETPARAAGLAVGDEILALDGYRVPPRGWQERLRAFPPDSEAVLTVARRERLIELPVRFGSRPRPRWSLEEDPEATAEQRERLERWLSRSPAGAGEEARRPASPVEAS